MNIMIKLDPNMGSETNEHETVVIEFQGVFELDWKRINGINVGDMTYDATSQKYTLKIGVNELTGSIETLRRP